MFVLVFEKVTELFSSVVFCFQALFEQFFYKQSDENQYCALRIKCILCL